MIAKIVRARQGKSDFGSLGEYITDTKRGGRTTAAERLAAYVTDVAGAGEKVEWSRVTNCASDHPAVAIAEIKATQAQNTRANNKTMHLVVSFPADERPSDEQLEDIEESVCVALGMAEHQRISALHVNTDYTHLHIALNRVHPTSMRCLDPRQSQRRLMAACDQLEVKHGLTRVDHGLSGETVRDVTLPDRAATLEAQTGRESFARWVQGARADLLAAKQAGSWQALHAAAAQHGLQVKPRGAGLVIADASNPRASVKASNVDRDLGMNALTTALGAYEPPEGQGRAAAPARRYEGAPLQRDPEAKQLFATYDRERRADRELRDAAIERVRGEHRAYRDELTDWYREQRDRLRGWRGKLAPNLGGDLRALGHKRAVAWDHSRVDEKSAIAQLHKEHPARSWQEWLRIRAEGGDLDALRVLRSADHKEALMLNALFSADPAADVTAIILKGRKPLATKDGRLIYRADDGGVVHDAARQVRVVRESAGAAVLAVELAQGRFGGRALKVEGSDQFQLWVAEHAARRGISVQFSDPKMAALAKELASQRHAGSSTADHPRPHGLGPLRSVPWSEGIAGELVFRGERREGGETALLWQQGQTVYVQPANAAARHAARDIRAGDTVRIADGDITVVSRGEELGR